MSVRVLTWNLQGRARPDLDRAHEVIAEREPDVVVLQEVRRRQAVALGRRMGWTVAWRFKHWPVVMAPEGLAVLVPEPPAAPPRTVCLAHFLRFWSWRRRIAVAADVRTAHGLLRVVNVHLGAHVSTDERVRQAALTVGAVGGAPAAVVAGDLNATPDSPVFDTYAGSGLRDAWTEADPAAPGYTNWSPGPRDRPPTQRLDYVLVDDDARVLAADVPSAGDVELSRYAALSDHLPVVVTLEPVGARFSAVPAPPARGGRRWVRRRRT